MTFGRKNKDKIQKFEDEINEYAKKECEIIINNMGSKGTSIRLNGESIAILVTLGGVIRKLLDETGFPEDLFVLLMQNARTGEKEE